jgi:hypothetical protein
MKLNKMSKMDLLKLRAKLDGEISIFVKTGQEYERTRAQAYREEVQRALDRK